MTNQLKYRDLCTAAYFGDIKMVKKLLGDGDEEVAEGEGEEVDFDAQEAKEENRVEEVNVLGTLKTFSNAVRYEEFGFGFDIFETEDSGIYVHRFKCSRKSSEISATPLHWAVLGSEPEMVKYLLRKGAKTRTTAGSFNATPRDIAVANDLPAVSNLFGEEEVLTLSQIEEIRCNLADSYNDLIKRTKALHTRSDIEITKLQYDTQAVTALSQDRSESKREPGRSHNYIKLLTSEDATSAHSEFCCRSHSKELLTELSTNIPGSTVGQFSLLAKRLSDQVGSSVRLLNIQLLTMCLFSCDSTSLRELLFLPPDAEDEIPDIQSAVLTDSSTVTTTPSTWGFVSHLIGTIAHSPLENTDNGFLHINEPTEEQSARLQQLTEGSNISFGGLTLLSVGEEGKKEALGESSGYVLIFNRIAEGFDMTKVSRFPSESEILIPCFSTFTVSKLDPSGDGTPTVITLEPSAGPVITRIDSSQSVQLMTECEKWQKKYLNYRTLKKEALQYQRPPPPPEPEEAPEEEALEEEAGEGADE